MDSDLPKRTAEELQSVLESISDQDAQRKPLEQWQPVREVEVDIRIDRHGVWWYQGREMQREALVKLFASILRKEEDGYFLVTPVEKARIAVEDAPFLMVDWEQYLDSDKQSMWVLATNLGRKVLLSAEYSLTLKNTESPDDQAVPYVNLDRGLTAKVTRNLYYQLIENGQQSKRGNDVEMYIESAGEKFVLGVFGDD